MCVRFGTTGLWGATTPARVSTAMPVGADIIRPPSGGPASGGPTFFPKESGGKERAGEGFRVPSPAPLLRSTKKGELRFPLLGTSPKLSYRQLTGGEGLLHNDSAARSGRPQVAPTDDAPSRRAPRIAVTGRASGNPSSVICSANATFPPKGGRLRADDIRPYIDRPAPGRPAAGAPTGTWS